MFRLSILVFLCFVLTACAAEKSPVKIELPASAQRQGDAQKGYKYLTEGAYITSGIPLKVFQSLKPGRSSNLLKRSGVNGTIPYWFTSVKSKHGADIVVPNCLTCHASHINGEFILGLGKFDVDFTDDRSTQTNLSQKLISGFYGADSPEYKSFFPTSKIELGDQFGYHQRPKCAILKFKISTKKKQNKKKQIFKNNSFSTYDHF